MNDLSMVEAAGVEPDTRVENTQLTDSGNASNAENATISKSAVQPLYKHCLKFPELQLSDFPAWCKNTLKHPCSIPDIDGPCHKEIEMLLTCVLKLRSWPGGFANVGK